MIHGIVGVKARQTKRFLSNGTQIPVTEILVGEIPVMGVRTLEKNGYVAIQLGWGSKKRASRGALGYARGAKRDVAPRFLKEVPVNGDASQASVGDVVKASMVLKPGDIVDVTGVSKGKGFAGVVKRHHFKGGPRTHGQSDRERAPGSIGQTTTPGRVYKGKRMAGRMGQKKTTLRNLSVVAVSEESILIKGLVPGGRNSFVMIQKRGEDKKFVPLYEEVKEEEHAS